MDTKNLFLFFLGLVVTSFTPAQTTQETESVCTEIQLNSTNSAKVEKEISDALKINAVTVLETYGNAVCKRKPNKAKASLDWNGKVVSVKHNCQARLNVCYDRLKTQAQGQDNDEPTVNGTGNLTVTDRECLDEHDTPDFEIPEGVCDNRPGSCTYELCTLSNNKTLLCDTETDGGGWLVITRRINQTDEFVTRAYDDYKHGFGDLNGNFWYGLENIHQLCPSGKRLCQLRLEGDIEGKRVSTTCNHFSVAGASDFYKVKFNNEMCAGDLDFLSSDEQPFVARQTPGPDELIKCAENAGGHWWGKETKCENSFLRGDREVISEMKVRKVKEVESR